MCATWSGRGQLWQAVAAAGGLDVDRTWTATDIRRRAHRVLLSLLAPQFAKLPRRDRTWADALPAETRRTTDRADAPTGRVDWARTRVEGWPPKTFHVRRRERRPDTLLASALKWTTGRAKELLAAAAAPASDVEVAALDRLRLLVALENHPVLVAAEAIPPRSNDIRALRSSGTPWRQLAGIAAELKNVESARLDELARTLLAPDDGVRDRLFHLAVLGEVLASFGDRGAVITSTGSIGGGRSGGRSAYLAEVGGTKWHVWFEAGGIWTERGLDQPYRSAASVLAAAAGTLAADILVIDAVGNRGLAIECKYSTDPSYVGRGGYHQATTYLIEGLGALAASMVSVTVGPSTLIGETKLVPLGGGYVGFSAPAGLAALIGDLIDATGPFQPGG